MVLLATELAARQDNHTPPVLRLSADASPRKVTESLQFFLDTSGQLTVQEVDQLTAGRFAPAAGVPMRLEGGTLWQRFDVVLDQGSRPRHLALDLPALDEETLYFRDKAGCWVQQEAGDTRAMSRWALPGRYLVFFLSGDQRKPQRYYLQIRHSRVPYSAVPELMTDVQLISLRQNEHMLLGIYFGLAMLVVVLASANALAYRDPGFVSFALCVAILLAAQGVTTGVAGLYWWPVTPSLNHAGAVFFSAMSAAAALWFVHTITRILHISPVLGRLMQLLMVVPPLCGIVHALLLNPAAFAIYNALVSLCVVVLMLALITAVFRGDGQLHWVGLGFLPVLFYGLHPRQVVANY